MRKSVSAGAAVVVVMLAGCAVGGSSGSAPSSAPSSAVSATAGDGMATGAGAPSGARPLSGGCGQTTVFGGPPPGWNASPAGFGSTPQMPYVLGARDLIMGYLWATPLRAGHPDNPSNKILWYVRPPRSGQPLRVHAHPRGAREPAVSYEKPADSSPGEIYPSGIDVPQRGCWTLELSWGPNTDQVDLLYT
jgi:hypothetical protein